MAKKVSEKDIFQDPDVYKNFRLSLDKTIKKFKEAEQAWDKVLKKQSQVASKMNMSAKSVAKLTEANRKSKTALKEKEAITKKILKAEDDLVRVTKLERQTLADLNLEKRKNNQVAKEQAILNSKLTTQYEKEQVQLNRLRRELKNLVLTEGEGTKATKKMAAEVQRLDNRLKKADAAAGQFQRNVGNYKSALKGAVSGLKSFAGALGVVGGVQLLVRGLRDTFDVVKNFDQAQADLSSVLGVSRDSMEALTAQAKELGATTKFTAAQVSELQIEYAKLGFTQQEIQQVTEATLQLAAASGTDLATAAATTGATLRGFGLDASETQRVVDVMAKSFSSSSLDMSKFSTAMASVAPVASLAGKTVEETTALLGTLTDAGIDAGTAGAGLRNMFLLANKAGLTFDEALDKIANSSDKTGAAMSLFGARGAALGAILAENREKTAGLTETLNGAAGAAGEMADKQLDTLQGSLDLLRSAWEGFILGADGSSGASEKLKNVIKFLADNLNEVLGFLGKVIAFWGTYKIAMKAAVTANNLFGGSLAKMKKGFGAVGLAITATIFIVKGLIEAFEDTRGAADKMNDAFEKVNAAAAEEEAQLRLLGKELFAVRGEREKTEEVLAKINEQYGTNLEFMEDEVAMSQQLATAYQDIVKSLRERIALQVFQEELIQVNKDLLELSRLIDESNSDIVKGGYEDVRQELVKYRNELEGKLLNLQKDMAEEAENTAEAFEEVGGAAGKAGKKQKESFDILAKFNALRREQNKELLQQESDLIAASEDADVTKEQLLQKEIEQRRAAGELLAKTEQEAIDRLNKAYESGNIERIAEEEENLRIVQDTRAKFRNDYLKFVEQNNTEITKSEIEKIKGIGDEEVKLTGLVVDENKKRNDSYKQLFESISGLAIDAANVEIEQINRSQEVAKERIQESQTEQQRLRELGTAEAAEALVAEKKREAREQQRINSLEKRKKDLLLTIVALERANQLIQSGVSNPFSTTQADLSKFVLDVNSVPGFFEGTRTDVRDALGAPNLNTSKDNYLTRLHGTEAVVNGDQYGAITRAFGYKPTTDEMTRRLVMGANVPMYHQRSSNATENAQKQLLEKVADRFEQVAKKHFKTTIIGKDFIEELQGNSVNRKNTNKGGLKIG